MSFVAGKIVACEKVAGKDKLSKLSVDVGSDAGGELTIVTNAPNVEEGKFVVVATVGCEVNGEPVKKATVGGVPSEGMLCDAPMLGWKGGGAGNAALLPDDGSFAPGDAPPPERPRLDKAKESGGGQVMPGQEAAPLFELKTKLSKEEKKAEAARKKAEREAKKAAKKAAEPDAVDFLEERKALIETNAKAEAKAAAKA